MAFKRTVTAALLFIGTLGLAAAQNADAPKPLVRKDLLVLGTGAPPPVVRDIFRPKSTGAAAPAVRRPIGPVTVAPAVPAPEAAPAFTLSLSYLGSIKSGDQTIGLVLRGGKTLDVAVGDEVAPGYKVVGITSEAIEIEGPNGERRTFTKQGDRP